MTKLLSKKHYTELLNLAQKLNSATTPQQAGVIITESAANLFGWDACYVHLFDREMNLLLPIVNIDTINGQRTVIPSVFEDGSISPFSRTVMEHGAKLLLRKAPFTFDANTVAFGDTNRPSASLMFVPVRDAKRVVGIFSVQSYTPNAYDKNDLIVLQSLADYCGGALERIRATENLREATESLARHADELEMRVAERTGELQKTIASLESFCYTIAHDLRAPLRSVHGFSRFLVEDYAGQLDATGQDYCRRISASASHMDNLIRDLLLYGKLAHKEMPLGNVMLEGVIDDALLDQADEIKMKAASVEVKRPLPHVIGNAAALEQIVHNLISNALKFTAKNTSPHISIWAESSHDKVRLYMQDNGIGIEPQHRERIFQVFERLHDAGTYPGTGIGLAIVRKGMERLGGRVGVESQPGKGSQFWIELNRKETEKSLQPA